MTKSTVENLDTDRLPVKQGTRESGTSPSARADGHRFGLAEEHESSSNLVHIREIPLKPPALDVAALKNAAGVFTFFRSM